MATILLIDDDETILDLYHVALCRRGHEVYCAANGADGLSFIENCSFDLVICDMFLPDTDGFNVLRDIKQMKPHQKVMIATGGGSFGMLDVLEMAEQSGADATFFKHDGLELLTGTVGRLVAGAAPTEQQARA